MVTFLMRYFLLGSLVFILFGCNSQYKGLQTTEGNIDNLRKFKPDLKVALYKTEVNVIGKYLSGLLMFKKMPDSSIRIVFTSEMGLTFFDFAYKANIGFKVFSILPQMNKKAVIKTLQKDFSLILMGDLDANACSIKKLNGNIYYAFPQKKGFDYYITDSLGNELLGIEKASKRKAIEKVVMRNYINGIPDTIGISHTTFNFTIGLKRIKAN